MTTEQVEDRQMLVEQSPLSLFYKLHTNSTDTFIVTKCVATFIVTKCVATEKRCYAHTSRLYASGLVVIHDIINYMYVHTLVLWMQ